MHEIDSGSSEHSSQLLTLHCHQAVLDTKPTSITWRCFVPIQSCLASRIVCHIQVNDMSRL